MDLTAQQRRGAATQVRASQGGGRKREAAGGGGADRPRPRRRKMFRVRKQGSDIMKERRIQELGSFLEVSDKTSVLQGHWSRALERARHL
jgi:hypothetical protein